MNFLKPFFLKLVPCHKKENQVKPNKMQTRKIAYLFFILLGVFMLNACEYEKIQPEVPPANTDVDLSTDIQPIFNSSCIGCHNGNTPPDLRTGYSYNALINGNFVDVNNPSQSILYLEMNTGGGMATYTNASDAALVLLWIEQGAENN
jgi:hypothetical protein